MTGNPEDIPRRGYRFPAGVPAELHEGGESFLCGAQNLSRTGVLLAGPFPTPTTERVDLTLRTPAGTLEVRLAARVIRIETDPEVAGPTLALEFIDLDDDQRQALEALLARLMEGMTAGPLEHLKPGASPQDIKKALDAIPLAHRVSLAQRAGLKEREFLRVDTNPAVLDALVRNPNLNLAEARAIAASIHLLAATIDALAGDPRFHGDEEVCLALVAHPRVSLATAERLTLGLKPPQLRKLLARPGLSQALRPKLVKRLSGT